VSASDAVPAPLAADAFDLTGRTAVITGAAKGLGAAIATTFGSRGATVVLCDRDEDGLASVAESIRSAGGDVVTSVLDVRDAAAVAGWIGALERVDVLVNNAGGTFHAAFMDVSDSAQAALVAENFTSVTTLTRCCVPLMPSGSSIINVTSVEAFRAAPGFAVYGAMKAAVEHLTRSLALELSDRGIRVNAVAPDALRTPGDAGLLVGDRDYGAGLALGWGDAVDVTGAVVFLASAASGHVTGTTVHVDGGSDAARGWRRTQEGWVP
jgi:NAD(P)-dependent dehydrogenase (short-subunit alcohol dehydrogenase family)